MKGKIASRKLWITIGVGVVWGVLGHFGIELPDGLIATVVTYLLGQSAVDIATAIKEAKTKK